MPQDRSRVLVQRAGPDRFTPRAVEHAGLRAKVVEVRARVRERDQPVRGAVLDEALQEARPGGLPSHGNLVLDPERVGMVA